MKILVVCTGNSARSQMAEALFRHHGGKWMHVQSAGTHPKGVNPLAIEVMKEIGIDISGHRSKNVSEFDGQRFDWVITVCDQAKENCPVFPFARAVHWDIQDPEELESFRIARDTLDQRVTEFLSRTDTAERPKLV